MAIPEAASAVARTVVEVIVALGFLLYGVENYNHRSFSADPLFRFGTTALAIFAGTLGILPLLLHFFPRAGRAGCIIWLSSLILFFVTAWLTRP